MLQESPGTPHFLEALAGSWFDLSKILGQLDRDEEMLAARRNAVDIQGQLLALDSAVPRYRDYLGLLYVRLGRTLCDLERLNEAEACFRQRQALWPGNPAKHEEALRELRQWAAQLASDPARLSPKEQARGRRYLDLCTRLERNGIAQSSGSDSRLP